jgi:hypothetical protein
MDMPVTVDFVNAVEACADAMQDLAAEMRRHAMFDSNNSVGNILRYNVELSAQQCAMLRDWVGRARTLLDSSGAVPNECSAAEEVCTNCGAYKRGELHICNYPGNRYPGMP